MLKYIVPIYLLSFANEALAKPPQKPKGIYGVRERSMDNPILYGDEGKGIKKGLFGNSGTSTQKSSQNSKKKKKTQTREQNNPPRTWDQVPQALAEDEARMESF